MAKKKEAKKVEKKTAKKRVATKVTYTESLKRIAKKLDISPTLVGKVLKGFGDELCERLADVGHFRFASFGSFNVKVLPPRIARNPRTDEKIQVGERKKVRFKAGSVVVGRVCGEHKSSVVKPSTKPTAKPTTKPTAEPTAEPEENGNAEDYAV